MNIMKALRLAGEDFLFGPARNKRKREHELYDNAGRALDDVELIARQLHAKGVTDEARLIMNATTEARNRVLDIMTELRS